MKLWKLWTEVRFIFIFNEIVIINNIKGTTEVVIMAADTGNYTNKNYLIYFILNRTYWNFNESS